MQVETLIHADWVVPVDDDDRVLDRHCLAIDAGRIAAIVPRAEAGQLQAQQTIELPGHALLPGLINAHTHAAMVLLRGLADDLPLMTWLHEHVWPAEARWVHEEFVADGTRLAIAEMIRGGTTCFNDMYFFPDVTARVARQAGMRATVGLIMIDFPSTWAGDAQAYLAKGLALHDELRGDPLVRTAFAPHAPYSVSDAPLRRIATLASELELPVHMHVHETLAEVQGGLDKDGQRPIARLHELGLINPGLVAVHMAQLRDEEIALFGRSGANVVHCPQSNLKLGSGHCPVGRLLAAGVKVALGTDGAASNNDLDMLAEMQTAALLAKGLGGDACAIPAAAALRMATVDGARILGIEDETGSLAVGKSADVIALDLAEPETQPVYNPVSQAVYAAGREQVRHVWIAGRQVLRDRTLTSLDLGQILAQARDWQARIHPDPG